MEASKFGSIIMQPGHPEFNQWLAAPPPGAKEYAAQHDGLALIAHNPESGVMEFVTEHQINELIFDAGLYSDQEEEI